MKLPNIFRRRSDGRAAPYPPPEYYGLIKFDPVEAPAIDPLETAAATLAKHGAELRRQARQQTTADRHAAMRAMQGDPTLRPALADVKAELAPLFARLDMRKASR